MPVVLPPNWTRPGAEAEAERAFEHIVKSFRPSLVQN
jgi:hypothetical protein